MPRHDLVPELQGLSEDILRASSPGAIAKLLALDLPILIGAFSARLYLFDAAANTLVLAPYAGCTESITAPIGNPPAGVVAAAVRCFRLRTPVNLPSLRRDTQVNPDGRKGLPRAAFFAPVIFGDEILGVVEALRNKPFGSFTAEDLAAIKLVADQVAASLKLQDQKQARDLVLRGQQLSASGELISSAAADLRPALDRILELCSTLVSRLPAQFFSAKRENPLYPSRQPDDSRTESDGALPELRAQALRASEIVSRLVSFSRTGNSGAAPVDLSILLNELVHFRASEWVSLGLRVQNRLAPDPSIVLGHRGQLEHILLDLALEAERGASETKSKLFTISSSQMQQRVVVEFTLAPDAVVSDKNLDPCRSVAQAHQGEIHLRTRSDATVIVLDVPLAAAVNTKDAIKDVAPEGAKASANDDLPGAPKRSAKAGLSSGVSSGVTAGVRNVAPNSSGSQRKSAGARPLTLMVVDSEFAERQQLLGQLAARGHRVIPVLPDETVELSQRMHFDGVIWAVRPGGSKWSEFQELLRDSIPTFVLATSGYDAELASSLAAGGGFLLARPVREPDLDRVLEVLDTRSTVQV